MAINISDWSVTSVFDFIDVSMVIVIILIIYYLIKLLMRLFKGFKFPSFGGGSGGGFGGGGTGPRGPPGAPGKPGNDGKDGDGGGNKPKLARVYGDIVNTDGTKLISTLILKKDGNILKNIKFGGSYKFLELEPGNYDISSKPEDEKYSSNLYVIKLSAGESLKLPIIHEESTGMMVHGKVVDHDEIPLKSVVTLSQGSGRTISQTTNSEGEFEFKDGLVPGKYILKSEPGGDYDVVIEDDLEELKEGMTIKVQIRHDKIKGIKLSGKVIDEEGNNLGCPSIISVFKYDDENGVYGPDELLTGTFENEYEFSDLGTGEYEVVSTPQDEHLAEKWNVVKHQVSVILENVKQDFKHKKQVPGIAVLKGKISDVHGNNLGCKTQITVVEVNEAGDEIADTKVNFVEERNFYEIPNLRFGRYKLSSVPELEKFESIGISSVVIIEISDVLKEYNFEHPLKILLPGKIGINVLAGTTKVKSFIQLKRDGENFSGVFETNPESDPSFVYNSLPPGRYKVIASYNGEQKESDEIELSDGEGKILVVEFDADNNEIVVTSITPNSSFQNAGVITLTVEGKNLHLNKGYYFPLNGDPRNPLNIVEGTYELIDNNSFKIDVNVSIKHDGTPSTVGNYDVVIVGPDGELPPFENLFEITDSGLGDEIKVFSVNPPSVLQNAGRIKLIVHGKNLHLNDGFYFHFHGDPSNKLNLITETYHLINNDSFGIDVNVSKKEDGSDTSTGIYNVVIVGPEAELTFENKFEIILVTPGGGGSGDVNVNVSVIGGNASAAAAAASSSSSGGGGDDGGDDDGGDDKDQNLLIRVIRRADCKEIKSIIKLEKDGKEIFNELIDGSKDFGPVEPGKYKVTSNPQDPEYPGFKPLVKTFTVKLGEDRVITIVHGTKTDPSKSKKGWIFPIAMYIKENLLPELERQVELQEKVSEPDSEPVNLATARKMLGNVRKDLSSVLTDGQSILENYPPEDKLDIKMTEHALRMIYNFKALLDKSGKRSRYNLGGLENDPKLGLKLQALIKSFTQFSDGLVGAESKVDKFVNFFMSRADKGIIEGGEYDKFKKAQGERFKIKPGEKVVKPLFVKGEEAADYYSRQRDEARAMNPEKKKKIGQVQYKKVVRINDLSKQIKEAEAAGDTKKVAKLIKQLNKTKGSILNMALKNAEKRGDKATAKRLKKDLETLESS